MATGDVQKPGRDVKHSGPRYQHQEDSRNGLPPVPGGRNAVGGGTQETDDGSRAFLTGEAACLGTVCGVQGGYGAWFTGSPSTDAAWEGNRWETELVNYGPWKGDTYLQAGLPNRRGTAELLC